MTDGSRASRPWIVAMTGASGAAYGVRCVSSLLAAGHDVIVLISDAARLLWRTELGVAVPEGPTEATRFLREYWQTDRALLSFAVSNLAAPIASGSWPTAGMIIVPCSMATLGKVAHATGENLIHRAADVTLKEGRPLIVVPRETPLNLIHLRNMVAVAEAGARVVPANPGWYHRPTQVDELIDFVAARVLDVAAVDHDLGRRWGGIRETHRVEVSS